MVSNKNKVTQEQANEAYTNFNKSIQNIDPEKLIKNSVSKPQYDALKKVDKNLISQLQQYETLYGKSTIDKINKIRENDITDPNVINSYFKDYPKQNVIDANGETITLNPADAANQLRKNDVNIWKIKETINQAEGKKLSTTFIPQTTNASPQALKPLSPSNGKQQQDMGNQIKGMLPTSSADGVMGNVTKLVLDKVQDAKEFAETMATPDYNRAKATTEFMAPLGPLVSEVNRMGSATGTVMMANQIKKFGDGFENWKNDIANAPLDPLRIDVDVNPRLKGAHEDFALYQKHLSDVFEESKKWAPYDVAKDFAKPTEDGKLINVVGTPQDYERKERQIQDYYHQVAAQLGQTNTQEKLQIGNEWQRAGTRILPPGINAWLNNVLGANISDEMVQNTEHYLDAMKELETLKKFNSDHPGLPIQLHDRLDDESFSTHMKKYLYLLKQGAVDIPFNLIRTIVRGKEAGRNDWLDDVSEFVNKNDPFTGLPIQMFTKYTPDVKRDIEINPKMRTLLEESIQKRAEIEKSEKMFGQDPTSKNFTAAAGRLGGWNNLFEDVAKGTGEIAIQIPTFFRASGAASKAAFTLAQKLPTLIENIGPKIEQVEEVADYLNRSDKFAKVALESNALSRFKALFAGIGKEGISYSNLAGQQVDVPALYKMANVNQLERTFGTGLGAAISHVVNDNNAPTKDVVKSFENMAFLDLSMTGMGSFAANMARRIIPVLKFYEKGLVGNPYIAEKLAKMQQTAFAIGGLPSISLVSLAENGFNLDDYGLKGFIRDYMSFAPILAYSNWNNLTQFKSNSERDARYKTFPAKDINYDPETGRSWQEQTPFDQFSTAVKYSKDKMGQPFDKDNLHVGDGFGLIDPKSWTEKNFLDKEFGSENKLVQQKMSDLVNLIAKDPEILNMRVTPSDLGYQNGKANFAKYDKDNKEINISNSQIKNEVLVEKGSSTYDQVSSSLLHEVNHHIWYKKVAENPQLVQNVINGMYAIRKSITKKLPIDMVNILNEFNLFGGKETVITPANAREFIAFLYQVNPMAKAIRNKLIKTNILNEALIRRIFGKNSGKKNAYNLMTDIFMMEMNNVKDSKQIAKDKAIAEDEALNNNPEIPIPPSPIIENSKAKLIKDLAKAQQPVEEPKPIEVPKETVPGLTPDVEESLNLDVKDTRPLPDLNVVPERDKIGEMDTPLESDPIADRETEALKAEEEPAFTREPSGKYFKDVTEADNYLRQNPQNTHLTGDELEKYNEAVKILEKEIQQNPNYALNHDILKGGKHIEDIERVADIGKGNSKYNHTVSDKIPFYDLSLANKTYLANTPGYSAKHIVRVQEDSYDNSLRNNNDLSETRRLRELDKVKTAQDKEKKTGEIDFNVIRGHSKEKLYVPDFTEILYTKRSFGPKFESVWDYLSAYAASPEYIHNKYFAKLNDKLAIKGKGQLTLNNPQEHPDDIPFMTIDNVRMSTGLIANPKELGFFEEAVYNYQQALRAKGRGILPFETIETLAKRATSETGVNELSAVTDYLKQQIELLKDKDFYSNEDIVEFLGEYKQFKPGEVEKTILDVDNDMEARNVDPYIAYQKLGFESKDELVKAISIVKNSGESTYDFIKGKLDILNKNKPEDQRKDDYEVNAEAFRIHKQIEHSVKIKNYAVVTGSKGAIASIREYSPNKAANNKPIPEYSGDIKYIRRFFENYNKDKSISSGVKQFLNSIFVTGELGRIASVERSNYNGIFEKDNALNNKELGVIENAYKLAEEGLFLPPDKSFVLKSDMLKRLLKNPTASYEMYIRMHEESLHKWLGSGYTWDYKSENGKSTADLRSDLYLYLDSKQMYDKYVNEWDVSTKDLLNPTILTESRYKDAVKSIAEGKFDKDIAEIGEKLKKYYEVKTEDGTSYINPYIEKPLLTKPILTKLVYDGIIDHLNWALDSSGSNRAYKEYSYDTFITGKIAWKYANLAFNNHTMFIDSPKDVETLLNGVNKTIFDKDNNIDIAQIRKYGWVLGKDGHIKTKTLIMHPELLEDYPWLRDRFGMSDADIELGDAVRYAVNYNYDHFNHLVTGTRIDEITAIKQSGYFSDNGNTTITKSLTESPSRDKYTQEHEPILHEWLGKMGRQVAIVQSSSAIKNPKAYRPIEREITDREIPELGNKTIILGMNQGGKFLYAYDKADLKKKYEPDFLKLIKSDYADKISKAIAPDYAVMLEPLTGPDAPFYMATTHGAKTVENKSGAYMQEAMPQNMPQTAFGKESLLSQNYHDKESEGIRNYVNTMGDKVQDGLDLYRIFKGIEGPAWNPKNELRKSAGRALKRFIEDVENIDPETHSLYQDLFSVIGKPKVIELMNELLDGNGDINTSNKERSIQIQSLLDGVINNKTFSGAGDYSLLSYRIKNDIDNMFALRGTGATLTLMHNMSAKADVARGKDAELRAYQRELRIKKDADGNDFTDEQKTEMYEQYQKDLAIREKQLQVFIDPETGVLKAGSPIIFISEKEFRMLREESDKNGLEFGLGSKILASRIPQDGPTSMGAFILGGVLQGEGTISLNNYTATANFGMDYDKDNFSLRIADKDFSPDIFDAIHSHWSSNTTLEGKWKGFSGQMGELETKLINGKSAINEEYGFEYNDRRTKPQDPKHAETLFGLTNTVGLTIDARKVLAKGFKKLLWDYVNGIMTTSMPLNLWRLEKGKKVLVDTPNVSLKIDNNFETSQDGKVYHNLLYSVLDYILQKPVDMYNQSSIDPLKALYDTFIDKVNGQDYKSLDPEMKEMIRNSLYEKMAEISGNKILKITEENKGFYAQQDAIDLLKNFKSNGYDANDIIIDKLKQLYTGKDKVAKDDQDINIATIRASKNLIKPIIDSDYKTVVKSFLPQDTFNRIFSKGGSIDKVYDILSPMVNYSKFNKGAPERLLNRLPQLRPFENNMVDIQVVAGTLYNELAKKVGYKNNSVSYPVPLSPLMTESSLRYGGANNSTLAKEFAAFKGKGLRNLRWVLSGDKIKLSGLNDKNERFSLEPYTTDIKTLFDENGNKHAENRLPNDFFDEGYLEQGFDQKESLPEAFIGRLSARVVMNMAKNLTPDVAQQEMLVTALGYTPIQTAPYNRTTGYTGGTILNPQRTVVSADFVKTYLNTYPKYKNYPPGYIKEAFQDAGKYSLITVQNEFANNGLYPKYDANTTLIDKYMSGIQQEPVKSVSAQDDNGDYVMLHSLAVKVKPNNVINTYALANEIDTRMRKLLRGDKYSENELKNITFDLLTKENYKEFRDTGTDIITEKFDKLLSKADKVKDDKRSDAYRQAIQEKMDFALDVLNPEFVSSMENFYKSRYGGEEGVKYIKMVLLNDIANILNDTNSMLKSNDETTFGRLKSWGRNYHLFKSWIQNEMLRGQADQTQLFAAYDKIMDGYTVSQGKLFHDNTETFADTPSAIGIQRLLYNEHKEYPGIKVINWLHSIKDALIVNIKNSLTFGKENSNGQNMRFLKVDALHHLPPELNYTEFRNHLRSIQKDFGYKTSLNGNSIGDDKFAITMGSEGTYNDRTNQSVKTIAEQQFTLKDIDDSSEAFDKAISDNIDRYLDNPTIIQSPESEYLRQPAIKKAFGELLKGQLIVAKARETSILMERIIRDMAENPIVFRGDDASGFSRAQSILKDLSKSFQSAHIGGKTNVKDKVPTSKFIDPARLLSSMRKLRAPYSEVTKFFDEILPTLDNADPKLIYQIMQDAGHIKFQRDISTVKPERIQALAFNAVKTMKRMINDYKKSRVDIAQHHVFEKNMPYETFQAAKEWNSNFSIGDLIIGLDPQKINDRNWFTHSMGNFNERIESTMLKALDQVEKTMQAQYNMNPDQNYNARLLATNLISRSNNKSTYYTPFTLSANSINQDTDELFSNLDNQKFYIPDNSGQKVLANFYDNTGKSTFKEGRIVGSVKVSTEQGEKRIAVLYDENSDSYNYIFKDRLKAITAGLTNDWFQKRIESEYQKKFVPSAENFLDYVSRDLKIKTDGRNTTFVFGNDVDLANPIYEGKKVINFDNTASKEFYEIKEDGSWFPNRYKRLSMLKDFANSSNNMASLLFYLGGRHPIAIVGGLVGAAVAAPFIGAYAAAGIAGGMAGTGAIKFYNRIMKNIIFQNFFETYSVSTHYDPKVANIASKTGLGSLYQQARSLKESTTMLLVNNQGQNAQLALDKDNIGDAVNQLGMNEGIKKLQQERDLEKGIDDSEDFIKPKGTRAERIKEVFNDIYTSSKAITMIKEINRNGKAMKFLNKFEKDIKEFNNQHFDDLQQASESIIDFQDWIAEKYRKSGVPLLSHSRKVNNPIDFVPVQEGTDIRIVPTIKELTGIDYANRVKSFTDLGIYALSFGGLAQYMEVVSQKSARVKAGIEFKKWMTARDDVFPSDVAMNQTLKENMITRIKEISIGNFVRTPAQRTELGRLLTKFAFFGREGIINQTKYTMERRNLFAAIDHFIGLDNTKAEAFRKVGIPIGDLVLLNDRLHDRVISGTAALVVQKGIPATAGSMLAMIGLGVIANIVNSIQSNFEKTGKATFGNMSFVGISMGQDVGLALLNVADWLRWNDPSFDKQQKQTAAANRYAGLENMARSFSPGYGYGMLLNDVLLSGVMGLSTAYDKWIGTDKTSEDEEIDSNVKANLFVKHLTDFATLAFGGYGGFTTLANDAYDYMINEKGVNLPATDWKSYFKGEKQGPIDLKKLDEMNNPKSKKTKRKKPGRDNTGFK